MKNLLTICATALILGNLSTAFASDFRINSSQPIINTPATGAGIAEPPLPAGESLLGPPNPGGGTGTAQFVEPPLPEEPVFNYRFIDAGYIYHDIDPSVSGEAGHGARFEVYHDISGPIYATGNFRWTSADTVDSYGARLGLGGFVEIYDRVHITLEGGGIWEKTNTGAYSESDFGYFVGPGFRIKFRQGVELFANAYYRSVNDDSGFVYRGGAVFDIKPKLDFTIAAEIDDDDNFYFAGIRYLF